MNTHPHRGTAIVGACCAALLLTCTAPVAAATLKQSIKHGAHEVKYGVKRAGKAVGHAAKETGHAIKRGAKRVKHAVKGS